MRPLIPSRAPAHPEERRRAVRCRPVPCDPAGPTAPRRTPAMARALHPAEPCCVGPAPVSAMGRHPTRISGRRRPASGGGDGSALLPPTGGAAVDRTTRRAHAPARPAHPEICSADAAPLRTATCPAPRLPRPNAGRRTSHARAPAAIPPTTGVAGRAPRTRRHHPDPTGPGLRRCGTACFMSAAEEHGAGRRPRTIRQINRRTRPGTSAVAIRPLSARGPGRRHHPDPTDPGLRRPGTARVVTAAEEHGAGRTPRPARQINRRTRSSGPAFAIRPLSARGPGRRPAGAVGGAGAGVRP